MQTCKSAQTNKHTHTQEARCLFSPPLRDPHKRLSTYSVQLVRTTTTNVDKVWWRWRIKLIQATLSTSTPLVPTPGFLMEIKNQRGFQHMNQINTPGNPDQPHIRKSLFLVAGQSLTGVWCHTNFENTQVSIHFVSKRFHSLNWDGQYFATSQGFLNAGASAQIQNS